ncbi:MAG: arsenate reductase family protein [Gammaproteobacteria bacterium]|nr:arsenate reductase family protein [Gammaproteobacteria bacterium]
MKFYQYPKCSTCRKAARFLSDSGIGFESIDITQCPPSKSELRLMLKSYGGAIGKLFNTSGLQYRELNMKDKLPAMNNAQAIDLLSKNGMLIKRPFLVTNDSASTDGRHGLVGFNEADWQAFIRSS